MKIIKPDLVISEMDRDIYKVIKGGIDAYKLGETLSVSDVRNLVNSIVKVDVVRLNGNVTKNYPTFKNDYYEEMNIMDKTVLNNNAQLHVAEAERKVIEYGIEKLMEQVNSLLDEYNAELPKGDGYKLMLIKQELERVSLHIEDLKFKMNESIV